MAWPQNQAALSHSVRKARVLRLTILGLYLYRADFL
jgi:hypothetical protein